MQYKGKLFLITAVLFLISAPLRAQLSVAQNYLGDPQLVGEARLQVMLWKVFDASLYTQSGEYDANAPFSLSLRYLRQLDGHKIVSKTMEEIRRQDSSVDSEQLALWEEQLGKIIPDVSKGTTITGVRTPEGYTRLYFGNLKIGEIQDLAFTQAFFDIWLGENTSNPRLRNNLIGSGQTSS